MQDWEKRLIENGEGEYLESKRHERESASAQRDRMIREHKAGERAVNMYRNGKRYRAIAEIIGFTPVHTWQLIRDRDPTAWNATDEEIGWPMMEEN